MTGGRDNTPMVDEPRTGVLLVRAWVEPDAPHELRARLLTAPPTTPAPGSLVGEQEPGDPTGTTWATAAGADAICSEVLRWLRQLDRLPDSADQG